jgi:protein-disulfide isomerase
VGRRAQAPSEDMSSPDPSSTRDARRRRLLRLGGVLLVAAVAVVVAIAVSSGGGGSTTGSQTGSQTGSSTAGAVAAAPTARLLARIPQNGPVLGRPSAPVRVVEFADLQCPFCREAALGEVPQIVQRDVRPGRVRIEFQTLAFIGPDSEKAGRFVEAAGLQDRLWHAAELLYAQQGPENSGWVTDELLRRVAAAIPGLDAGRVLSDMGSAAVTARLRAADALARRHGVQSTPTFLVGRGAALRAVGTGGLQAAVDAAVAQR